MLLSWRRGSLATTSLQVMLWQGVRLICLAGWVVVAARALGASNYGLFSGVVGTASALAGLVGLGSGMLMYQYAAADRTCFPRYWKQALCLCLATGVPLAVVAILVAGGSSLPLSSLLMIAAAEVVAFPFITNTAFAFSVHDRLAWSAALPALNAALRLAAIAAFIHLPIRHDLPAYLQLHMLASFMGAGLALTATFIALPRPAAGWQMQRGDLGHGLGHAASWTTAVSVTTLDKSFVLHAGGSATAGLYAACYRIAAVAAMPLDALVMSAMPRLFRAAGVQTQPGRLLSAMVLVAVFYSACVGCALWWGAAFLPWVLGKEFEPAVPALRWMGLFVLAYSLRQIACNALVGRGHKLRKTAVEAFGLMLILAASLLLVPAHGVQGAVWMIGMAELAMALAGWALLLQDNHRHQ